MNWIEAIATVFGILAVWLVVRRHMLCWPAGLVQVTLYVWIFYQTKLYSDMILHVIYIFLQIYGWYHWSHPDNKTRELPVTRSARPLWQWSVLALTGAGVWGYLMATYTDAALPWPDAFIVVTSLVAQWLTARKHLESWLFWIVVNVVAIFVYWAKDLYFTTGLYVVFLVLAVLGYVEWRKAMQAPIATAE